MNDLIQHFYQQVHEDPNSEPIFFEVLVIEENSNLPFEKYREITPKLPRGWYELSLLDKQDRIEFTKEFWLKTLPFQPHLHKSFEKFFLKVEDVGVYLTKDKPESDFEPELAYSMADGTSFFRGFPPANMSSIQDVKLIFNNRLPRDFLAFSKIHDGFCRYSDVGIFCLDSMKKHTAHLHQTILQNDQILTSGEKNVDPTTLIPFYKHSNQKSFQCFYEDWYPASEMGNVCFSAIDFTISDIGINTRWKEELAFPTFLDWLNSYLQQVYEP